MKTAEMTPTNENDPMKSQEVGKGQYDHLDPQESDAAAWEAFLEDGPSLLRQNFDGFQASAKGDQDFVGQNFSTKDYTAHSPLLRKYVNGGHVATDSTLQQRVKALTGRK